MIRHPWRRILAFAACIGFVAPAASGAPTTVCPLSVRVECQPPCEVAVPIVVSGSGTLNAVGVDFRLTGPGDLLTWRHGNIARGWRTFAVNRIDDAVYRIGGYDVDGFTLTGNDTLAVVVIGSIPGLCTSYSTEALVDDIATCPPCAGRADIVSAPPLRSNGFVSVLARDAQACAYATPDGTVLEVRATLPVSGEYSTTAFRIVVTPPAPAATFVWRTSDEVATLTGDPIDNGAAPEDSIGAAVRFTTCRSSAGGDVRLGTIEVHGLSGEHDILVVRSRRATAGAPSCPYFRGCDDECSGWACMMLTDVANPDGVVFRARVNGSDPVGCVAVAPRTWSQIKRFYRD